MHQHKISRFDLIRRVFIYGFMTSAVIGMTALLILVLLGYRLNRDTGEIKQGGLVQFISQPSGASVTVGQARLANPTRSKITLNSGEYPVTFERDGYQLWRKNISIKSGQVLWLNSARLIPKNPETETIFRAPTIHSAVMRRDGDDVALLQDSHNPDITFVSMNSDTVITRVIDVPDSIFGADLSATYMLVRWLNNNRYILMTRNVAGQQTWAVIDTQSPDRSVIVASPEGQTIEQVLVDPSNDRAVYLRFSGGGVTRLDVTDGQQIPTKILNAQSIFVMHTGTILYVAQPVNNLTEIGYVTSPQADPKTIRIVNTSAPVAVAGGTYFNDFYLATSIGSAVTVQQFEDFPNVEVVSSPKTLITFSTDGNFESLDLLSGQRFVAVKSAGYMSLYDVELSKLSPVKLVANENQSTQPVWTDEFHYMDSSSGWLRQYEFDGTNQVNIVRAAAGYPAAYSSNNRYVYSIGTSEAGMYVQRTRIVLAN